MEVVVFQATQPQAEAVAPLLLLLEQGFSAFWPGRLALQGSLLDSMACHAVTQAKMHRTALAAV